jgi:hypothetical protein
MYFEFFILFNLIFYRFGTTDSTPEIFPVFFVIINMLTLIGRESRDISK